MKFWNSAKATAIGLFMTGGSLFSQSSMPVDAAPANPEANKKQTVTNYAQADSAAISIEDVHLSEGEGLSIGGDPDDLLKQLKASPDYDQVVQAQAILNAELERVANGELTTHLHSGLTAKMVQEGISFGLDRDNNILMEVAADANTLLIVTVGQHNIHNIESYDLSKPLPKEVIHALNAAYEKADTLPKGQDVSAEVSSEVKGKDSGVRNKRVGEVKAEDLSGAVDATSPTPESSGTAVGASSIDEDTQKVANLLGIDAAKVNQVMSNFSSEMSKEDRAILAVYELCTNPNLSDSEKSLLGSIAAFGGISSETIREAGGEQALTSQANAAPPPEPKLTHNQPVEFINPEPCREDVLKKINELSISPELKVHLRMQRTNCSDLKPDSYLNKIGQWQTKALDTQTPPNNGRGR